MCTVTVIVNKAATRIFFYKKTVLHILNLLEFVCKQLKKHFEYTLIRKKNTICRSQQLLLWLKTEQNISLLYRKSKIFSKCMSSLNTYNK